MWATIAHAIVLVSAELRRLGLDADIDLSGLNARDLAGRARAYGQLRKAGMTDSEARRIQRVLELSRFVSETKSKSLITTATLPRPSETGSQTSL